VEWSSGDAEENLLSSSGSSSSSSGVNSLGLGGSGCSLTSASVELALITNGTGVVCCCEDMIRICPFCQQNLMVVVIVSFWKFICQSFHYGINLFFYFFNSHPKITYGVSHF